MTTIQPKSHIPALDGLRAIAVLLVLRIHLSGPTLFPAIESVWGCRGVGLFFILSGFLITRILLRERERGRGDLIRFYAHRAGRIFPLYFAVVGVLMLIYGWRWETWSIASYTFNFVLIGKTGAAVVPCGPFWSLCVEEHFYLVWPVVVALLPIAWSRRVAMATVVGALALAGFICWRWGVYTDGSLVIIRQAVYHNSFVQAAPLAIGCLLAYAEPQLRESPRRLLWLATGALLVFYAAPPFIGWRFGADAPYYMELSEHVANTGLALAGFAVALWCAFGDGWAPLNTLLTDKRAQYIGRISYGLYLLHYPIYWAFGLGAGQNAAGGILRSTLALVVVFAVAAASHKWFESPIREWVKARTARRAQRPVVPAQVYAGVVEAGVVSR